MVRSRSNKNKNGSRRWWSGVCVKRGEMRSIERERERERETMLKIEC